jgi:hypothetical protein
MSSYIWSEENYYHILIQGDLLGYLLMLIHIQRTDVLKYIKHIFKTRENKTPVFCIQYKEH